MQDMTFSFIYNLEQACLELTNLLAEPKEGGSFEWAFHLAQLTRFIHCGVWGEAIPQEEVVNRILPLMTAAYKSSLDVIQEIPDIEDARRTGVCIANIKCRIDNLSRNYIKGGPSAFSLDESSTSVPITTESSVSLLYQNRQSSRVNTESQLIVTEIGSEMRRFLSKDPSRLYDLTARQFEELVAGILQDFGYDVELTPATRDGGFDIYAYLHHKIGTFLTIVECKKQASQNHVGVGVVQRLFGVQQTLQANKSLIVTTSFFTDPAKKEASRHSHLMDLKDFEGLKEWLKKYE
ncbi:MAG: restriction endonuclease [Planctomycetota bacterium]|jgi:hypothetical protein